MKTRLLLYGLALVVCGKAQTNTGEALYKSNCAGCHELSSARIPQRDDLAKMSQTKIVRSLQFGVMSSFGRQISARDRVSIAQYLSNIATDAGPKQAAFCKAQDRKVAWKGNWNGWSPTTANLRYVTADAGGLTVEQVRGLKLKWAFGFEGDVTAMGAPTVVDGRVYTGSASGIVYALDAESGCILWTFTPNGPVRSAIRAVKTGAGHALLFGDQNGWVYSLDSASGKLHWKKQVETHPAARLTASLVEHDGVVFVGVASFEEGMALNPKYECCTFRGSVVALRVKDGEQVWKRYLVEAPQERGVNREGAKRFGPSGVGVWSAPTLDTKRGRLYITTGDNYSSPATGWSDAIMALELSSGKVVWVQQTTANDAYTSACRSQGPNCPEENGPDFDYGASAMLVSQASGKDVIVAGQKSGMVYAMDPDAEGKILWSARAGVGGVLGGVQWGIASDGQLVFAAVSDLKRIPKKVSGPADLRTYDFDRAQGGGITAFRIEDGKTKWHVDGIACAKDTPGCGPGQSMALTAVTGVVFSGAFDGHLRGYSTEDGRVVWDMDTAQNYTTVNGVEGKGGSMDGAGPVVSGGMLFVTSGYSRFGGMPGNVLLVFAPEGGKSEQKR